MVDWKRVPITPYRNYEVSSDGRIRRGSSYLKGCVDRYGYRTVQLYYSGLPKRFKVHRLVCEAFSGPCPEGNECAHLDGNKNNNAANNLRWVSRSENQKHNVAHGVHGGGPPHGDAHHSSKLTAEIVRVARRRHADGVSGRKLAVEYGVTSAVMSEALRGRTWKTAKPCAETPPDLSSRDTNNV